MGYVQQNQGFFFSFGSFSQCNVGNEKVFLVCQHFSHDAWIIEKKKDRNGVQCMPACL